VLKIIFFYTELHVATKYGQHLYIFIGTKILIVKATVQ